MPDRHATRSRAASLVAWLAVDQAREALARLHEGEHEQVVDVLRQANTELPDDLDLEDAAWREALLDALEAAATPEDDEDPDVVQTTRVPNYAAFAKDLRSDD